jgi:SIR2-like domain
MSDDHYGHVISAFEQGEVIPFLGAGVNLFEREEAEDYTPGSYLPSGRELASYLANNFQYNLADRNDLLRVSQYGDTVRGWASLYNRLGEVFDSDYPINELHRFFARLPATLKKRGSLHPYQLIITTNYDDVLEEALREAREPFDIVSYVARKTQENEFKHFGKFRHTPYGALPREGTQCVRPGEFKDASGFAVRLRDGADPASRYLLKQFSDEAQRFIESYDGSPLPPDGSAQIMLAGELNALLCRRLFEREPFEEVGLPEAYNKAARGDTKPNEVACVNRLLLEEAYPHEVARSPKSHITIEDPNTYNGLPFDYGRPRRTIIFKIHGEVDRVADRRNLPPEVRKVIEDSFVITEDDYINYLARTDISKLVPAQLKAKLNNSGLLFLGYGLRDWNLRVIMQRLWGEQGYGYASWAIQLSAQDMDKRLWLKRNVSIIEMRLEEYVKELDRKLK